MTHPVNTNFTDATSNVALINETARALGIDTSELQLNPLTHTFDDMQLPYLLRAWDYTIDRQVLRLFHDTREYTQ